jgi:hypothetical protein
MENNGGKIMVIIREYNYNTDGYSTNRNESYRFVRDRMKKYWKERNGEVLSTKKTKTKDYMYCTMLVKVVY